MNLPSFTLGPVMKAARKFKKFNQADVAQAIGCSQSALSKMEHNLLIPSAPQWFLFSRFTTIPPESLESGIIDRHTSIKFNSDEVSLGFKIPKRYRTQRAEKIREIYPFLRYLEKEKGEELKKNFIQETGLEPEFFLDFDNLINFQLLADAVQFLARHGLTDESHIRSLAFTGQDDNYWNHYGVEWKKLGTPRDVLVAFVKEQIFFQTDFQLRVEEGLQGGLTVSYQPEFHLKGFKEQSPELVRFLNLYRKFTLENLIQRVLGQTIEARIETEPALGLGGKFLLAS